MTAHQLLLADENEPTRRFLAENLTADGYRVDVTQDRSSALARLSVSTPDLIVTNVNGDTLGLLDAVRASTQDGFATAADTPVIVLSAAASELARVRLLERGADDVIATPFSYLELRARIAAVLRRTAPRRPQAVLNAGPLRVDVHQRTVRVGQQPVQLSSGTTVSRRGRRSLMSSGSRSSVDCCTTRRSISAIGWPGSCCCSTASRSRRSPSCEAPT